MKEKYFFIGMALVAIGWLWMSYVRVTHPDMTETRLFLTPELWIIPSLIMLVGSFLVLKARFTQ